MGQVKAPKMSCESHPLPPSFEIESDDEAGEGSPQHEDACDDQTIAWRSKLPHGSSPAIPVQWCEEFKAFLQRSGGGVEECK